MKALWLENQKLTYRDDLPVPIPGQDEALIKITKAGICSTDLELTRGYYPFTGVPGHEFVGVVEDVNGDPRWTGKRVVGEINITCGSCQPCLRGLPNHCEKRKVLGIKGHNGVFCEYITLPIRNLHWVPDPIPDDAAVFTEPLAAAFEIIEQIDIQPKHRVMVIGAGRLGQLIARVLSMHGCELLVVTKYASQQNMLKDHHLTCISETQAPTDEIDFVIEATGSPSGLKLALLAVRARGTVVLKSTYAGSVHLNASKLVVNEITMVGSRCGPFEPAIKALEMKIIEPEYLISARFDLSDGVQAFETAMLKGVFKVLFEFNSLEA